MMLLHLFAATPAHASTSSSSSDSGAIVAAVIAAVVALASALISAWGVHRQQTIDRTAAGRSETLQRELAEKNDELQRALLAQQQQFANDAAKQARILTQMNELYGPLFMLRSQSRQLRARVGPESSEWRVVDHIQDLKQDAVKAEIVEDILAINVTISQLLIGKAGLLEQFPPPASFQEFLPHAELLQDAWNRGENQSDERLPFPLQFDVDVKDALDRLRAQVETH